MNDSSTPTKFVIESGVPVPPRASGAGESKYPFNDMKVGDSFFAPACSSQALSNATRAYKMTHAPGSKWTTRKEGDGVRVWRIA